MTNRDYLSVDRFLQTELDAKALQFALKSGLIDRLQKSVCSFDQIPVRNTAGRRMLADLLVASGVIEMRDKHVNLTQSFRSALAFRELLEAKLAFAEEIATDISRYFPLLIDDLPRFMESSETFRLFRYDRCFDATDANVATTERWVRFTTALTRHEGRVLAEHLDLTAVNRLLDIGGNSGELAIQLCVAHPHLSATVFDLPVVCQIGRAHVATRAPSARITFVPGDMRRDAMPEDMDAVTLKSLLHDWPDEDAIAIITRAARTLRPGGLFIIFERGPLRPDKGLPYAQLSNLVFFHFFREPDLYMRTLRSLGFESIRVETIRLESDFNIVTARRPVAGALGSA